MKNGILAFRLKESLAVAAFAAMLWGATERADAESLDFRSNDSPSFAVFNNQLFMAFSGTDSNHRLNYAVSSDGLTYTGVSDQTNVAGSGPAIAAFNKKMYVAFPYQDNREIAIASSDDGLHYSGQHIINPLWKTPARVGLGSNDNKLFLVWLGMDGALYRATTTDGTNWTADERTLDQSIMGNDGKPYRSYVIWPPTLASVTGSDDPGLVYTYSEHFFGTGPNWLQLRGNSGVANIICGLQSPVVGGSPVAAGIQAGVGFLDGKRYLAWRFGTTLGGAVSTIQVSVDGGGCRGGTTYPSDNGSYGQSHSAPAIVGFNGHVYLGFTGTDGDQHINVIQVL